MCIGNGLPPYREPCEPASGYFAVPAAIEAASAGLRSGRTGSNRHLALLLADSVEEQGRPKMCTSRIDTSQSFGATSDWNDFKGSSLSQLAQNFQSKIDIRHQFRRELGQSGRFTSISDMPSILWNTLDSLLVGRYFGSAGASAGRTTLTTAAREQACVETHLR